MRDADIPRLELDDDALGRAVEENVYALLEATATLPGGELVRGDGCTMHHAFPTSPMFKGVWDVRRDGADRVEVLRAALEWQAAREAPFAFVWAGSGTMPEDLPAAAAAVGLEPWDVGAPAQAAALEQLDWEALARVPDGFTVERVTDDDGLVVFADTFCRGFGVPEWAGQAWVDATRALGIDASPWSFHVGRIGPTAVATNVLFCGAGVASVFGIGTVPAARGQGIGAAITLAGLQEARERRYRYAVLFATEQGAPVYRRIGFRDTGHVMHRWLWRAPS